MPHQSILPYLLEQTGGMRYPDNPADHQQNMQMAQGTFPAEQGHPALEALKKLILGPMGLNPEPGERVGDFWSRQYPNTMPPSMKGIPKHGDINLPAQGLSRATRP
jgi:hypothetical protein